MANKVGRPTLYTPELLTKARRYITDFKDYDDPIPSIAGLACVLGVRRETCHAWAKDPEKVEFYNILKELMERQERELIRGGLGGAFNPPITKMMMTKHGYSDRLESDHTSSDGSMSPNRIEIVAAKSHDDGAD